MLNDFEKLDAHFSKWEGDYNFLYLDSHAIPTIGKGCVVNLADCLRLQFYHKASNDAATEFEITSEFMNVVKMEADHAITYYMQRTNLRVAPASLSELFRARLNTIYLGVVKRIENFDSYPLNARIGILDMAFNLGAAGLEHKFPTFLSAIQTQDWATAADECERLPPVSPTRNEMVRGLFESLISAKV